MPKIPSFFNWSGGKDSTLALHHVLKQQKLDVRYLLTSVNASYERISMHGVRQELLDKQVKSLNIPLIKLLLPEMPDMETYEELMFAQMQFFKDQGINTSVFGDIFLEDLKKYREEQLACVKMEAVFPLWKRDTKALLEEFIDLGYKTIVVCAKEELEDFCGRIIDRDFIKDLPLHIDPCGENGEFHTFVFEGPIFSHKIDFKLGEKVYRTYPSPSEKDKPAGCWYQDLI
jgi:uncharacterized protein (TIGR00290 family)